MFITSLKHSAVLFCVVLALLLSACTTRTPVYRPVSIDKFEQNLAAWGKARPGTSAKRLQREQIIEAAENMLLMQRNDGGWPSGRHPLRELSDADRDVFLAGKHLADSSFANHNVFPQIYYLSHVYLQTGDVRYRNAANRGLAWVMNSQFYNGGWPERPTSVDGTRIDTRTTLSALVFMRNIAAGKMPYGYIPFDVRRKAADAVRKGDEWLLRVQQAYDSRASIWASTYGLESSKPIAGKGIDIPALDAQLSVDIVRYLMAIERPPSSVRRAVEGAVSWYQSYSVQQWQASQSAVAEHGFINHSPRPLPGELVWARFYDPEHNVPYVGSRSAQELDPVLWFEQHQSTVEWFGTWPRTLVEKDYVAWRKKLMM